MAIIRGIKNGLLLLWRRDWREFIIRLRISIGQIDLKHDPSETVTARTHYYADSGGLAFDSIMKNFNITTDDAIIDYGCGKGGILITLSKYPFAKITGVEIDPMLVEIAENNIRKLKIANVDIVCSDAAEFKNLAAFNYFYFFDPFPCNVMQEVINNIEDSLVSYPRKATIIYLNPLCHELIELSKIFCKVKELPHFEHKCFVYENDGNT